MVNKLNDKLQNVSELRRQTQEDQENASPSKKSGYNSQIDTQDSFKQDLENLLILLKRHHESYDSSESLHFGELLERIEDLLKKYVKSNGIDDETFVAMMNELTSIQVEARITNLRKDNDELITKAKVLVDSKESLEMDNNQLLINLDKRKKDLDQAQRENESLRRALKEEKQRNAEEVKNNAITLEAMNMLEKKVEKL